MIHRRELPPWSCTKCRAGECSACVDELRHRVGFVSPICSCKRKDHIVLRLYKIAQKGDHSTVDEMIQTSRNVKVPVAGSGLLGDRAFIQAYLGSDEDAINLATIIVGVHGWEVSTGYGIHRRVVLPARSDGSL